MSYARSQTKVGKVVVLVPEMTGESNGGGGRRSLENPSADGLAKLVRSRVEAHGIKSGRVFATGFSMGGGLLLSLLNDDPTLFSHALVVGASGKTDADADVKAEVCCLTTAKMTMKSAKCIARFPGEGGSISIFGVKITKMSQNEQISALMALFLKRTINRGDIIVSARGDTTALYLIKERLSNYQWTVKMSRNTERCLHRALNTIVKSGAGF